MEIVIWYPKSTFATTKSISLMRIMCIIYACITYTYKINKKARDVAQW